jgi:chromosome segregation ATPase
MKELREHIVKAIMDHVVDGEPEAPEALADLILGLMNKRCEDVAGYPEALAVCRAMRKADAADLSLELEHAEQSAQNLIRLLADSAKERDDAVKRCSELEGFAAHWHREIETIGAMLEIGAPDAGEVPAAVQQLLAERDDERNSRVALQQVAFDWKARAEAAEQQITSLREVADTARTRLQHYADEANAGRQQAGGRELSRKIWGAFAELDALLPARSLTTDEGKDG